MSTRTLNVVLGAKAGVNDNTQAGVGKVDPVGTVTVTETYDGSKETPYALDTTALETIVNGDGWKAYVPTDSGWTLEGFDTLEGNSAGGSRDRATGATYKGIEGLKASVTGATPDSNLTSTTATVAPQILAYYQRDLTLRKIDAKTNANAYTTAKNAHFAADKCGDPYLEEVKKQYIRVPGIADSGNLPSMNATTAGSTVSFDLSDNNYYKWNDYKGNPVGEDRKAGALGIAVTWSATPTSSDDETNEAGMGTVGGVYTTEKAIEADQYTITYKNGSESVSAKPAVGTATTLPDKDHLPSGITAPSSDFEFVGWRSASTNTDITPQSNAFTVLSGSAATINLAKGESATVEAVWQLKTNPTINGSAGTSELKYNPTEGKYTIDLSGKAGTAPTVSGDTGAAAWKLAGWSTGTATSKAPGKTATADTYTYTDSAASATAVPTAFYSVFSRTVSVTYDPNGKTFSTAPAATTGTQYYATGATAGGAADGSTGELSLAATAAASGATFLGWSATAGGAKIDPAKLSYPAYNASAAQTVYALWDAGNIYVHYYDFDGTTYKEVGTADQAKEGSTITLSKPARIREGWDFGGWFTDAAGNSEAPRTTTETISVYAKWTRSLSLNKGVAQSTESLRQTWVASSASAKPTPAVPALADDGDWKAVGWTDADSGAPTATTQVGKSGGDYTGSKAALQAVYARAVTLRLAKNLPAGKDTTKWPANPTAQQYLRTGATPAVGESLSFELPAAADVAASGYEFGGWNTQADGNGTSYDAGGAYTATVQQSDPATIAAPLYATWTAEQFTVQYFDGDTVLKETKADLGDTVTVATDAPAATDRSAGSWTLVGWVKAGAPLTAEAGEASVTSATKQTIVLQALWKRDATLHTGDSATETLAGAQRWNPSAGTRALTVAAPTAAGAPAAAGDAAWEVVGWTDDKDKAEAVDASPYTGESADLWAVYKRAVTLSYDENLGAFTDATHELLGWTLEGKTAQAEQLYVAGQAPGKASFTAAACAAALRATADDGQSYVFAGWRADNSVNTHVEGTDTNVEVAAGAAFEPEIALTGAEAKLYAVWTEATLAEYAIGHFQQQLDGTYKEVAADRSAGFYAADGAEVDASLGVPNSYTGFKAGVVGPAVKASAAALVVAPINYDRQTYAAPAPKAVKAGSATVSFTVAGASKLSGGGKVAYGDTVTITPKPTPVGYSLTYTVKWAGGTVTVTNGKFTMPAGPVTITATAKATTPARRTPAQAQAAAKAAAKKAISAIPKGKGDNEPDAADPFNLLQARITKAAKTKLTVSWTPSGKAAGAKYFMVYGNKCGAKNSYEPLYMGTDKKLTFTKKNQLVNLDTGKLVAKVKKATSYKFVVIAFDDQGEVLATSKTVHAYTPGSKYGKVKKIKMTKKAKKVKAGKKATVKFKITCTKKLKQHRKVMFESTDESVIKVVKNKAKKKKLKGSAQIKAVGKKGQSATIYAYACDGHFAKFTVTIK